MWVGGGRVVSSLRLVELRRCGRRRSPAQVVSLLVGWCEWNPGRREGDCEHPRNPENPLGRAGLKKVVSWEANGRSRSAKIRNYIRLQPPQGLKPTREVRAVFIRIFEARSMNIKEWLKFYCGKREVVERDSTHIRCELQKSEAWKVKGMDSKMLRLSPRIHQGNHTCMWEECFWQQGNDSLRATCCSLAQLATELEGGNQGGRYRLNSVS